MRPIKNALLARAATCAIVLGSAFNTGAVHSEVAADSADRGSDIVVTGTREAQRKAIAAKKSSDNIVETLYANDVGKLPDQNVAEAVRRLPGISVANDQGEGRYVVIRGIAPNLVNVTLNGQTLPAPEPDSRQVKLDDIPSAMIASVTVSKTLTADQDGAAVGGEVNIRTLSAFDRTKTFFVDARGEAGWYRMNGKAPYEADIQVGLRNDLFGAVVSASYSRRPIESENFQGGATFNTTNGGPDQFGLRDYNLVRERTGLVGNFDWHPNESAKIFLRTSYSRFSDNERRDQNRSDQLTYTPVTATTGTFTGRGSVLIRRRIEKDNTKSAELGGDFDLAGGGKLAVAGTFTRAIKNDPLRSEFNFRGSGAAGAFDLSQSPYGFAFTSFDPSKFSLNTVNYDVRRAKEDLYQGRADLTWPIFGESLVKAGAKYLRRIKTNNRDFQQYSLAKGAVFTAADVDYLDDLSFYGAYTFGPRIDYDAGNAFIAAHSGTITQSASNLQSSRNNSQVNDYDVREDIWAGYVMATVKIGRLTIIPGVRIEHTKDRQSAKLLTNASPIDQGFNSFTGGSYTDVLPGLNVRFDASRQLVFRGAVTTAIGRPNYPDLAPYISIDTTASPTSITLGNPGLKHYKAVNLDAAVEYYPSADSILSASLFYKHIDNPIYSQTLTQNNITYAGQSFAQASVVQSLNADSAFVSGIELNAQSQLTFLPGLLSGFGVSANYTHIEGHGRDLPGRAGVLPLFLQSHDIGTAQLFYEKNGLALCVAYSFRSAYLDAIGANVAGDQYTDHHGQLDVHGSYQISSAITVFADGTNLNNAPWRRYLGGIKSQLLEREQYDLSFRGGVQLHF